MKKRYLSVVFIITILFMFEKSLAQDFDFFEPKVTIAGYGEVHYNYSKTEIDKSKKTLDFHRFVLFVGYTWSEKWSFKSEIELEHNIVDGEKGELELEQAFVNFHHANYFGFQAGVVLVPAGLTNEYHEPPRFFGVERPDYAKVIIPTTWFGNGVALYGNTKGLDYKLTVMEGLNSDKFSPGSGIRDGRQKGFKADASHLLYNAKLDYTGISGLRFGASYAYNNAQGDSTSNTIGLAEFHAQYQNHGLYSVFEIGNITYSTGEVEASHGYYFDLAYNLGLLFGIESKIIPFFRYSDINTAAKTKLGGDSQKEYHYTQWMIGLSFQPIDQLVFKIDYGKNEQELNSRETTLFNLGVGYVF